MTTTTMKQTMSKTKQLTVYICGHSPEAFKSSIVSIKKDLRKTIIDLIKRGYRYFAISLTRDAGMLAGEIVLELRKKYPSIKLICVDINSTYHEMFSKYDSEYTLYDGNFKKKKKDDYESLYQKLKESCDVYKNLSSLEQKETIEICREWIINKASVLVAVYCAGTKGFIKDTIALAENLNLIIQIIGG